MTSQNMLTCRAFSLWVTGGFPRVLETMLRIHDWKKLALKQAYYPDFYVMRNKDFSENCHGILLIQAYQKSVCGGIPEGSF